jgi:hypothetical protein
VVAYEVIRRAKEAAACAILSIGTDQTVTSRSVGASVATVLVWHRTVAIVSQAGPDLVARRRYAPLLVYLGKGFAWHLIYVSASTDGLELNAKYL